MPKSKAAPEPIADANGEKLITLVSNDGDKFTIPKSAAKVVQLVVDSLDLDHEEEEPEEGYKEVEILRVRGETLERVVEFAKHYAKTPLPEINLPLTGPSFAEIVTDEWYQNFPGGMDRADLFEVISAANYMTIKPLLDLACLWITFQMMGKNTSEIREMLNMPELTEAERIKAQKDHPWLFEEEQGGQ